MSPRLHGKSEHGTRYIPDEADPARDTAQNNISLSF